MFPGALAFSVVFSGGGGGGYFFFLLLCFASLLYFDLNVAVSNFDR